MNLDFFVSCGAFRRDLFGHRSVESCFQLTVVHLTENFETVFESCYWGVSVAWVFVSESAALTDVLLEEKIWLPVSTTDTDTFRIVGEVDDPIFDPLEVISLTVLFIKHSVFPIYTRGTTQTSWALVSLKLTSIMGIFDEKLHMFGHMDVDDDRSVVLNVEL